MPELPEVETVRRDLCSSVCGRTIVRVSALRRDMIVGGSVAQFRRAVEGATIQDVARRGKVLILRLSSAWSLLVHFRMTGQMYPLGPQQALPAHTRTVLELDDGRRLVHVDLRRLGTLEVVPTAEESRALSLAHIGPDALEVCANLTQLQALLARRKCTVKAFLLDQRCMSGIGNIYACEILARSGIAPDIRCDQLSLSQVRKLASETRKVLLEAVTARGTTISDYRTGSGQVGNYRARLRVYGREGKRCWRRGCPGTVARVVQNQRSTYYCPACQGTVASERTPAGKAAMR